jgi:hypothetical protein
MDAYDVFVYVMAGGLLLFLTWFALVLWRDERRGR